MQCLHLEKGSKVYKMPTFRVSDPPVIGRAEYPFDFINFPTLLQATTVLTAHYNAKEVDTMKFQGNFLHTQFNVA